MFNLKISKKIRDFQLSFVSLATSSFAHLLLRIVVGKELGPSGLGLYTMIFTIYILEMQIAGFGIDSAMIKYIAEYHENKPKIKEYISSGVIGAILNGSIVGLLLYMLSGYISINFFHNPEMIPLLKITSFCLPFIAVQKTVLGFFVGLRKMKLYAIANISLNMFVMILSVILVLSLKMEVRGAVIGFVVPTIIIGLLSLITVKGYFTTNFSIIKKVLKDVSVFGFYATLSTSIGQLNTEINTLMIGHFMDKTTVGYFAVAALLIEGMKLIPNSVDTITFSHIASYYGSRNYEFLSQYIKEIMYKVFIISIAESLGLILFGQFIIETFFGNSFLPAYPPLLILLIGCSISAPVLAISSVLPAIGEVKLTSKILIICFVTNIFLNILLIPKYGMIGAAVALSISSVSLALLTFYFIKMDVQKLHEGHKIGMET
jgi:O-antigen/teichoic acid export membrane protein